MSGYEYKYKYKWYLLGFAVSGDTGRAKSDESSCRSAEAWGRRKRMAQLLGFHRCRVIRPAVARRPGDVENVWLSC